MDIFQGFIESHKQNKKLPLKFIQSREEKKNAENTQRN